MRNKLESGAKINFGGTDFSRVIQKVKLCHLSEDDLEHKVRTGYRSVSERGQGGMCQGSKQNSRLGHVW